ncbi:Deoxyhypusine hydroxylase [Paraphysoderma sedebokerense]|nr:Deoxyhypusine hydroxylase [Paraphysoderma sedebokerense]
MAVDLDITTPDTLQQARSDPNVYSKLESILLNRTGNVPMAERFRALFTLKALGSDQAIDVIGKGFSDSSALLKHELAYVLGQMKNPYSIPVLTSTLSDASEDAMVRHEAAEALGAIGESSVLDVLEKFLKDEERVVRETCELAVERIKYEMEKKGEKENLSESPFTSIDPAPPLPIEEMTSVSELKKILLDSSKSLFHRYRAMFSLRNIGTEEAVLALAEGFHDESALFRHEIAYVFGQLQHPASVPSLITVLANSKEQSMVRHEAAEALGSIATPECLPILQKYKEDHEDVVKESCQVGVDMWEFENSGELQYADGLSKVVEN